MAFLWSANAVTDIFDTTSCVRSSRWFFPKTFLDGRLETEYTRHNNLLPGPPLEKLGHPMSCNRARDVLEEVYDVVPE